MRQRYKAKETMDSGPTTAVANAKKGIMAIASTSSGVRKHPSTYNNAAPPPRVIHPQVDNTTPTILFMERRGDGIAFPGAGR